MAKVKKTSPKRIKVLSRKSRTKKSIEVGVIPYPAVVGIDLPESNWISRMKEKFPKAVNNFMSIAELWGFKSFDEICEKFSDARTAIEMFFKANGLPCPVLPHQISTEEFQGKLVVAFRKAEEVDTTLAW